jgi:hypothetical protein
MKRDCFGQTARRTRSWVYLVICLAIILAGCSKKEAPLSKAGETCKKTLLAEMNMLTTSLNGPVAQQDWGAVNTILQTSFEKLQKEKGMFAPDRIGVLDQNGITQGVFPIRRIGKMDFRNYQPAKVVYEEKRITPSILYLEGNKIFVLIGPLLQKDQVTGAVVMVFSEESLQKWHVPEKEFLSIDFNR